MPPDPFDENWQSTPDGSGVELEIAVGHSVVTMKNGAIAMLVKTADTRTRLEAVQAGTERPIRRQAMLVPRIARELGTALLKAAHEVDPKGEN